MPVKEIIKINKGRWQIEESFRILKSDFKSRPVFVRVKDRIQAHFIICFISLLVFRLMHRRINEIQAQKEEEVLKNNKDQEVADSQEIPNKMYTNSQIIRTLKNMRVTKVLSGYAGSFTSTGLTDILQSFLGETRFDCEYLEPSMLRRSIKNSKKRDIKKSKKFRIKNPKGGHCHIFEMSRTSGTVEFLLIQVSNSGISLIYQIIKPFKIKFLIFLGSFLANLGFIRIFIKQPLVLQIL